METIFNPPSPINTDAILSDEKQLEHEENNTNICISSIHIQSSIIGFSYLTNDGTIGLMKNVETNYYNDVIQQSN